MVWYLFKSDIVMNCTSSCFFKAFFIQNAFVIIFCGEDLMDSWTAGEIAEVSSIRCYNLTVEKLGLRVSEFYELVCFLLKADQSVQLKGLECRLELCTLFAWVDELEVECLFNVILRAIIKDNIADTVIVSIDYLSYKDCVIPCKRLVVRVDY